MHDGLSLADATSIYLAPIVGKRHGAAGRLRENGGKIRPRIKKRCNNYKELLHRQKESWCAFFVVVCAYLWPMPMSALLSIPCVRKYICIYLSLCVLLIFIQVHNYLDPLVTWEQLLLLFSYGAYGCYLTERYTALQFYLVFVRTNTHYTYTTFGWNLALTNNDVQICVHLTKSL